MSRPGVRLVLAFLLSVLAGCTGAGGARVLAESAVERHRELYDAERFATLAAATDPEMKKTVPDSQFVSVVRQMYGKLGPTGASRQTGSNVMVTLFGGVQVTLVYETQFDKAAGQEQFVFRVRGGHARLLGWQVNSPAFLPQ